MRKETQSSVVHIDCYEPRLAEVRRVVSSFPHDIVTLKQLQFKRGPGALSPELRRALSEVYHCTAEQIALVLSTQLLEKKGCDELLNDIKLFHQQMMVILYTCLTETEVHERFRDLTAMIHIPVQYVEYDAEKNTYPTFSVGRDVLDSKLRDFLFPFKKGKGF